MADHTGWDVAIEGMPHFRQAMARVEAWVAGAIIDRPPVRFMAHNQFLDDLNQAYPDGDLQARWFDAEFRVEAYLRSIEGKAFHGETFPFFYPFLGPDSYAAFYGGRLDFTETTSWMAPLLTDIGDLSPLDRDYAHNAYFRKSEELIRCALERCAGKCLVGYPSLHPGVDAAAAWRGHGEFCLDLIDSPEQSRALIDLALDDFAAIFGHFDAMLKGAGQLSLSWLGVPSFGTMHIPGCDFATFISPRFFEQFALPALEREASVAGLNIFHLDGPGVARHVDAILEVPGVHAVQWAQGVGEDRPIMQWVPLIEKIQARRPVIVDLTVAELEPFISVMRPEGLFLWVGTGDAAEQQAVIERLERWT